jgi:carbonic anhydrase
MDIIYRYDPFAQIDGRLDMDADAAVEALREGHARYVEIVTRVQREVVAGPSPDAAPVVIPSNPLSLGLPGVSGAAPVQAPFAVVLGCSDARVPVELVFDQSPNDLFVVRVAGNVLGVEGLGSIDYAVEHLGGSVRLLLVLGHTGCGAVGAAVDAYLAPKDYADIAFTHALRSLVDRVQIAVRGAAHALERVGGARVAAKPGFRAALWEVAVYLNAALTAFDVRREIPARRGARRARVVYGVFDLVAQRVGALPHAGSRRAAPLFGEVPDSPDGFNDLGTRLARAAVAKGLLG